MMTEMMTEKVSNKELRRIYLRDVRIGGIIDDCVHGAWATMPDVLPLPWLNADLLMNITREFLVIGRFCAIKQFDSELKNWVGLKFIDPDTVDLTPIPFVSHKPKISCNGLPIEMSQCFVVRRRVSYYDYTGTSYVPYLIAHPDTTHDASRLNKLRETILAEFKQELMES